MLSVLLPLVGAVLLIVGADLLVKGASKLAGLAGLSPLIIGLTIVAIGTSSPEIAVTIMSTLKGESSLAIGNIVGSNICNILLIGGVCALAVPLMVNKLLKRIHLPVMIFSAFMAFSFGKDGILTVTDGCLMLAGYIFYLGLSIKSEKKSAHRIAPKDISIKAPPITPRTVLSQLGVTITGLAILLIGSELLVRGAVALAQTLGISETVIGLTIVAVGTSLPEIATSSIASWRGEREIAIGNIIGSNIANILCVLPLGCLFSGSNGLMVNPEVLAFDFPLMLATSAVFALMGLFAGEIDFFAGAFLLVTYILYLIITVAASGGAWWAPEMANLFLAGTVFIGAAVAFRAKKAPAPITLES